MLSSRTIGHPLSLAIAALTLVTTILLVVPFAPLVSGLHGEPWRYAMNIATSQHMVFGRDIVFTAGPLSSIYTRAYHPATDAWMLGGALLLAIALFVGSVSITPVRRWGWLLLIPLLLSQVTFEAGMLMGLPLLLVLTAEQFEQRHRYRLSIICLVAIACAILPLIKATMSVAVAVCTLMALTWMVRRSWLAAIGLVALQLATLVCAWVGVGQPLAALPGYFISQLPVVSGYTVAMESPGPLWQVITFVVLAAGVVVSVQQADWRRRWPTSVALAATTFLAFKAGFVRHDTHAIIAASSLALASILFFLAWPHDGFRRFVPLVLGVGCCVLIAGTFQPVGYDGVVGRLRGELHEGTTGLWHRISGTSHLDELFASENARLRRVFPLPATEGDVDVYPENLAPIFADGMRWNPRPMVLSYSAYTPELQRLDANHVADHGASRIFFQVGPLDGHYPTLEDGASWPTLLSRYEPTGMAGQALVLDRRDTPLTPPVGAALTVGSISVGKQVPLPQTGTPLWATLDLKPTLVGRLAGILYKMPTLVITMYYPDGSARSWKFIPGMATTGFLISPTVDSTRMFLALRSSHADLFFPNSYPVAFSIAGNRGTRWLWSDHFDVTVSSFSLQASAGADNLLFSQRHEAGPIDGLATAGQCTIDSIGDKPRAAQIVLPTPILSIRGWAVADGPGGVPSQTVDAILTQNGHSIAQSMRKTPRGDVSNYFKHPEMAEPGFETAIDGTDFHGTYQLRIRQTANGVSTLCPGEPVSVEFPGQPN